MDSRLLNVLRDDPFDGTFSVKYENDVHFWSSGSDAMGLQLSETLQGILPIAATEDAAEMYEHVMLKDDFQLDPVDPVGDDISADDNALIYEHFTDQQLTADDIGEIEIVTVDPNADIDTDSDSASDNMVEEVLYTDEDDENEEPEFDNRSQCSNSTFRTRTDSSSIGDYESHTSDYDDEDYLEEQKQLETVMQQQKLLTDDVFSESGLLVPEDLILEPNLDLTTGSKTRTISTNTFCSDVDGLGLHIDASTFDLADFITKDDFVLHSAITTMSGATQPSIKTTTINTASSPSRHEQQNTKVATKSHNISGAQIIPSIYSDSDSDSDVIVDVETVELDAEEQNSLRTAAIAHTYEDDNVPFVDNVKSDPSWNPKDERKKHDTVVKEAATLHTKANTNAPHNNSIRSFTIVPNKRQCNLLKGKLATNGRAPNKQAEKKNIPAKVRNSEKSALAENVQRVGMGKGSKNLAFIKHDRESISQQVQESPVSKAPQKEVSPVQAIKRKLNLEEYKKRRSDQVIIAQNNEKANNPELTTTQTIEKDSNLYKPVVSTYAKVLHTPNTLVTPHKHSDAVTSIVKCLKEQQTSQLPATDPITLAKNKVLRMQELKRAQQLKIIDSAVSAKVPRVTKLLPLKEIIRDAHVSAESVQRKDSAAALKGQNSDYEEIIIVSASCNTDISIPPLNVFRNQKLNSVAIQHVNDASRSLLKSSVLLYNISNTVQRVQAAESMKISTNSLISSIQDVVVKQTLPIVEKEAAAPPKAVTVANTAVQHGENKIIMHLRKDRSRKRMVTISTQTDFQPEFLALFPTAAAAATITKMSSKSTATSTAIPKRRQYRRRERKEHSHTEDSDSDGSHCSYRSRSHSIVADSCSSSAERVHHCEVANSGGYSSRSSHRHRSSVSSSYSECDRKPRQQQRQRHTSFKRQRRSRKHTRSCSSSSASSSSSTLSDYSGRSRSRSRNRTRSRSPLQSRWQQHGHNTNKFNYIDRNVSQPAVEERRIVYVGRIEQETTKEMLRRKFLPYGPIHQITIHYKETGMKYGFVTYERSQDAFTVIDSGARDPQISMYDISFGGRRAFCRATYADLDNAGINTYHSYVFPKAAAPAPQEDSFEALLLKVKAKMGANKTSNASNTNGAAQI